MRKLALFVVTCVLSLNVMAILPVAKIIEVKGKGKVNSEVASIGLEVAEGNKVELRRGEKITIEFQNGHKLSLQNASVVFDTLNPKDTLITLERGTMLVEIKALTQNENFHVRSNNVIVSTGSSSYLMDNNGVKTKVTVESGKVQIQRLKEAMDLDALEEAVFDKSPRFEKKKIQANKIKKIRKNLKI